jgi:hypothetical protein
MGKLYLLSTKIHEENFILLAKKEKMAERLFCALHDVLGGVCKAISV